MGITAGTIGAICGTPADVALVRMCVDNRLPESQRRNYTRTGILNIQSALTLFLLIFKASQSVFDAWRRIIAEEGIMALWTGCGPTIGRAMVVNVCQLCCQTQAKEEIAKRTSLKEGYILSFLGAMIAGFINSCVSLPIDIAKTRLQNMKVS